MSKRHSSRSQDKEKEETEFQKLVQVCRMATELLSRPNFQPTNQHNITACAAHSYERVHKISWKKMTTRADSSSPSCNYDDDDGKRDKGYMDDGDYLNHNKGLPDDVKGKKKSTNHYDDQHHDYSPNNKDKDKHSRNNNLVQIASLPPEFKIRIQDMGGDDVKLIIQKHLFEADTLKNQNRFSIPINQVQKDSKDFLTDDEKLRVPMEVPLIEPNLNLTHIVIRKWNYSGKSSSYMLCGSWSAVRSRNNLQVGMPMQLWSFRVDGELNFALVKVSKHNRQDHDQVYGIANTSQINAELNFTQVKVLKDNRQDHEVYGIVNTSQINAESRHQQHAIEQINCRNEADQDGGHILMDAAASTHNQMEDID